MENISFEPLQHTDDNNKFSLKYCGIRSKAFKQYKDKLASQNIIIIALRGDILS